MGSLAPRSYNISQANQVGRSSEKSKKLRAFVLKMCIEITSAEITVSFKKNPNRIDQKTTELRGKQEDLQCVSGWPIIRGRYL
jgi:hypothetical protein